LGTFLSRRPAAVKEASAYGAGGLDVGGGGTFDADVGGGGTGRSSRESRRAVPFQNDPFLALAPPLRFRLAPSSIERTWSHASWLLPSKSW
jgi:hypothetical protein